MMSEPMEEESARSGWVKPTIAAVVVLLLVVAIAGYFVLREVGKQFAEGWREAFLSPIEIVEFGLSNTDIVTDQASAHELLEELITCTFPEGYVARYAQTGDGLVPAYTLDAIEKSVVVLPAGQSCCLLHWARLIETAYVLDDNPAFSPGEDISDPPLPFTSMVIARVDELDAEDRQRERISVLRERFESDDVVETSTLPLEGKTVVRVPSKDGDIYGVAWKGEKQVYWNLLVSPTVTFAAMGPADGFDEEAVREFVGSMEVGKETSSDTIGGEDCR